MAYVTQAQIETAIPAQHLVEALDDDRDGSADAGLLDSVIAQASQAVDAFLSPRYDVPFDDPAPSPVAESAFVFVCELLYQRRGLHGDENPFTERADAWRKKLEAIAKGEGQLEVDEEGSSTPGAAITETATIDDTTR
jgi:phage gp36-like protein